LLQVLFEAAAFLGLLLPQLLQLGPEALLGVPKLQVVLLLPVGLQGGPLGAPAFLGLGQFACPALAGILKLGRRIPAGRFQLRHGLPEPDEFLGVGRGAGRMLLPPAFKELLGFLGLGHGRRPALAEERQLLAQLQRLLRDAAALLLQRFPVRNQAVGLGLHAGLLFPKARLGRLPLLLEGEALQLPPAELLAELPAARVGATQGLVPLLTQALRLVAEALQLAGKRLVVALQLLPGRGQRLLLRQPALLDLDELTGVLFLQLRADLVMLLVPGLAGLV